MAERERRPERVPWPQLLFDDIFLILMAGLVVPTLFYLLWGLIDLGFIPLFGR
ncbi:MAG: hypothetical protein RMK01_11060 [Thermomicrobium sp.]|nr:hypothetical protein [Thermomicrobium sp.]